MKKILIVIGVLLLTGCKSELVCVLTEQYDTYETQTKSIFEFDDDKIVNAYSTHTMTFESEEEAKTNLNIFKSLGDDYKIVQKSNNQIEITVSKEYEIYNNDKEAIINELESDGYFCG